MSNCQEPTIVMFTPLWATNPFLLGKSNVRLPELPNRDAYLSCRFTSWTNLKITNDYENHEHQGTPKPRLCPVQMAQLQLSHPRPTLLSIIGDAAFDLPAHPGGAAPWTRRVSLRRRGEKRKGAGGCGKEWRGGGREERVEEAGERVAGSGCPGRRRRRRR